MMSANPDRGPGRIEFRADDPSLTPYAGLAVSGELCRRLRLVELIDAELAAARVAPVKQRRRGLSAGEFAVAIAECQLAGAEGGFHSSSQHHRFGGCDAAEKASAGGRCAGREAAAVCPADRARGQ
jgi:hypothetical protein